ncbi:cytochrome c-type biogenesis protein CcmH [Modicisalibacter ilicicola DSM 19980]|uniref:Cytochrome c-type biogenesis protein CcmH n=1 Tax=Modicisalibacter ilicicola DSM 19980 TaxID=1121942 RepID=A0A1M4UXW5_9GAMM|nr:c-type cytochrome biogenesis protein CcmI [Halomonas ilicicola]SHE61473.1 cytochrome c-type biogenesis protein CcmH [Halomonas ilicicola DSM 19980]
MNLLWIALGLLLLPALWIIALPLRRARAVHEAQHAYEEQDLDAAQNVAVYQRRLASLEQAHARGDIDAKRFEESRLELDRSLLEDTEESRRAPLKAPGAGRWVVPVVMVLVVVASLLWYQREGAQDDLALYTIQREVMNAPNGSMAMLIERLESQIDHQPENPKLWMALFPLYRDSGRLEAAIDALERLIALEGRRVELLAQLAQMKFFAANRTLTAEVQGLVDETLDEDPRQPTVLGMLGIEAFEHGRYEEAIDHWRRAIAGFDDEEAAGVLRNGIAIAQQRLGITPERPNTAGNAATGPSLSVSVSLAESLVERADPQDTVFVVARDSAGELPPLALERATVADLPLEVTLDDSDAMAPSARLSQVDEVRLTVRVSASGQATPQPGDLAGEAGPVALGDQTGPVDIVIDRVVD